jgi:hypothetical protein
MYIVEALDTPWLVEYTSKVRKQKDKLPPEIRDIFYILKGELEQEGPEQTEWRNYGLIVNAKDVYHCHLNSRHPRYVAVWKVIDREMWKSGMSGHTAA